MNLLFPGCAPKEVIAGLFASKLSLHIFDLRKIESLHNWGQLVYELVCQKKTIDCMVALPGQLFYATPISAGLCFLAKDKSNGIARDKKLRDRRGQILFIDARRLGHPVDRTRRELRDEDIAKIADTYHAWQEGNGYEDVPGFCKSASLEEIRGHNYVLTPGRYVGATAMEEEDVPFEEKMAELTAKLGEQFKESARLEATIRKNLEWLGWEV